jgi:uncharacterized integral membrane protein (TIGR00697 family)
METIKDKDYNISFVYMSCGIIFTTCLLLSNILAAKIIQIGRFAFTGGVIIFPISYIVGDIITEVYGFRASRRIILLGFSMNVFMVLALMLAIIIPSPIWFDDTLFKSVLGSTPRIVIAGLISYLVGSTMNAVVLSKMKLKSINGRNFGLRAIISTIVGEGLDSTLFILISFTGTRKASELCLLIFSQIIFKILYECILLPITTIIVNRIKNYENIDIYGDT